MAGTTADYFHALQRNYADARSMEHAYRPALKAYLETLLKDTLAINDPKRQQCGAPDFIVKKGEIDIGYIEAKNINVPLNATEKGDQMKRYRESLDNLILTDYLEFRFWRNREKVATVRIAEVDEFFTPGRAGLKAYPERFATLETLLQDFAGFRGQTIKSAAALAEMMARKAKLMRDVFERALREDAPDNTLRAQWKAFQDILIHDMDEAQFADVYAQTITYGLFTARLHDTTLDTFSREEARTLIPRSNPFVRQLFDYVCGANLDDRVVWIVDALCEVYRAADVHSILQSFGRATGRTDPIVHFYEDFLGAYDAKLRKARGVWYTPEPVVNFIVRAVDEVLKTHFHLPEGLADTSKVEIKVDQPGRPDKVKQEVHRVQLLDVAAGTGTFTAEAIKQIHARFAGQQGMWSSYVEEHLLPRLHGFEILMASYAMCHLKIDLLLQETGYKPKDPKNPPRLGVYLTNALEEHHPDVGTLFASWLAKEANEASRIKKDMPIMVAYGNPPYSGHSANKGKWIEEKLRAYKQEPGGGKLKERNPKWLNDDYVKFIRLAEHYIEKNGQGVLAYITNHGYLDNPTFRGMRWHLLNTFDDIYVLDLHGNAKKKEVAPDGSPDKNVFDIQQGVAIIIAVKHNKRKEKLAHVHHSELWGVRKDKYDFLWNNNLKEIDFCEVGLDPRNYFFLPKNNSQSELYSQHFKLNELFPFTTMGVITKRDSLVIQHSKKEIWDVVQKFSATDLSQIHSLFGLQVDNDWNASNAKLDLVNSGPSENFLRRINYAPFDKRHTYYTGRTRGFMARPVLQMMRHMQSKNVGLVLTRKLDIAGDWSHAFLCDDLMTHHALSQKEGNYLFPLYLYPDESDLVVGNERALNLDKSILGRIIHDLSLPFIPDHEDKDPADRSRFSPLDLLDYIYAVLHSPSYRRTYKEFLKIDFPRVPYPTDAAMFWRLAALGAELRGLHLMEHPALATPLTAYPVSGDHRVEKAEYAEGRVWINATQYFEGVPQAAWDFFIGGYQPARKWLKDRKGRALSLDDLRHYAKIVVALTQTGRLMAEIDAAWQPQ